MRSNRVKKSVLGSGRSLLLAAYVVSTASAAVADVKLPGVFGDHMVVQRDRELPVWGWADPGEKVTVSMAGQTLSAVTDQGGRWSVRLAVIGTGGPHRLIVRGNNTIELGDVLVGEVWLCSGQSNMAMSVGGVVNAEEEIARGDYPKLRMLNVQRQAAADPQDDCQGQWKPASPATVGGFSATAYFFGRKLHRELDVPVGLINASWGGTAVEAWTSIDVQTGLARFKPVLEPWKKMAAEYDPQLAREKYEKAMTSWKQKAEKAKADGRKAPRRPAPPTDPRLNQNHPASLFNGMIAPLVPYGIRGAIWYQGERNSNGERSVLYGLQLATLITDWRARFGQGDFPFLFVQLPNFTTPQESPSETGGWVMVREGMFKTLALGGTGMAVTLDIGEEKDIHPKNKQDVGKRLALWALGTTYGRKIVFSGPLYRSMRKQGGRIVLDFDHVGDGLVATGDGPLVGFAVAGADRKFVWADAEIDGATVVVLSPQVNQPMAVRYAWAANPKANLANRAGLPAGPFRTDDWVEVIEGR